MIEFTSYRGHKFVFRRNMWTAQDDERIVSWSDPKTGSWEPKPDNQAGAILFPNPPAFNADNLVRQLDDGSIAVGERYVLRYCGMPFVWGLHAVNGE